jgi:hypothetical protein
MDAGFVDLVCFPSLVTLDRPGGSIWSNRHFGKGEQSARVAAGRVNAGARPGRRCSIGQVRRAPGLAHVVNSSPSARRARPQHSSDPFLRSARKSVRKTPRWREVDSNPRSPVARRGQAARSQIFRKRLGAA